MVIGTINGLCSDFAYPWNIAIQSAGLLLGAVSCTAWALFGSALRRLTSPRAVRPSIS